MLLLKMAQIPSSGVLDSASEAFSLAGGVFITVALVLALTVALYLTGRRPLAARLAATFAVASLIEVALKLYLPVPPLPLEYLRSAPEDLIVSLPNPYPSGHVMRSLFIAGTVALLWPRRPVWIAATIFLVAMAATRIYLGVHWASDVVGGILLGFAALAWAFGREEGYKGAGHSKERVR
jgi:undecaprenyl-diphosphatase